MVHIGHRESFHKLVEEFDAEICYFNSMCSSICVLVQYVECIGFLRYFAPKSKRRSTVVIKGCTKRRKTPGLCLKVRPMSLILLTATESREQTR